MHNGFLPMGNTGAPQMEHNGGNPAVQNAMRDSIRALLMRGRGGIGQASNGNPQFGPLAGMMRFQPSARWEPGGYTPQRLPSMGGAGMGLPVKQPYQQPLTGYLPQNPPSKFHGQAPPTSTRWDAPKTTSWGG